MDLKEIGWQVVEWIDWLRVGISDRILPTRYSSYEHKNAGNFLNLQDVKLLKKQCHS
jgi:hypothetical protein